MGRSFICFLNQVSRQKPATSLQAAVQPVTSVPVIASSIIKVLPKARLTGTAEGQPHWHLRWFASHSSSGAVQGVPTPVHSHTGSVARKLFRSDLKRGSIGNILDSWQCPHPKVLTSLLEEVGKGELWRLVVPILEWAEQQSSVEVNSYHYGRALSAVADRGAVRIAKGLLDMMVLKGHKVNEFCYSSMIAAYTSEGDFEAAEECFVTVQKLGVVPNVFCWTSLAGVYAAHGNVQGVESILERMNAAGCEPNQVTWLQVAKAYGNAVDYQGALTVVDRLWHSGVKPHAQIYNCVINTLCKAGRLGLAERLIDKMQTKGTMPNEVTLSIVLIRLLKDLQIDKAEHLLARVKEQGQKVDTYVYTAMLEAYGRVGGVAKAEAILERLQKEGVKPKEEFTVLIHLYGEHKDIEGLERIIGRMRQANYKPSAVCNSAIVNAYGRAAGWSASLAKLKRLLITKAPLLVGGALASALYHCVMAQRFHEAKMVVKEAIMRDVRFGISEFSTMMVALHSPLSTQDKQLLLEVIALAGTKSRPFEIAYKWLTRKESPRTLLPRWYACQHRSPKEISQFPISLANALWLEGAFSDAALVLSEGTSRLRLFDTVVSNGGTWCLDLHFHTPISAKLVLILWFLRLQNQLQTSETIPKMVSIITGQGKNSRVVGESAIRSEVLAFLVKIKSPFRIAPSNPGALFARSLVVRTWLKQGDWTNYLDTNEQKAAFLEEDAQGLASAALP